MTSQELDIFRGVQKIREQESNELAEVDHSALLKEAFDALTDELDTKGNTRRFKKLIEAYSKKLISYWRNKIVLYDNAKKEGKLEKDRYGKECHILGDEKIYVSAEEEHPFGFVVFLKARRVTSREEDFVQIAAHNQPGFPLISSEIAIDGKTFPRITSQVRSGSEKEPDISYRVEFSERIGRIRTFERTRKSKKNFGRRSQEITEKRVLEFFTFG